MMASTDRRNRQTPLQAALMACMSSFLLVFAYSCGFNLLLLSPSIYLLQIYDRVLSSRSVDTLVMLTLIVCVAVLTGGLLDTVRRMALSRIATWLDDRLRPVVLLAAFEYASQSNPARANEAYRDLGTLRQFIDSPMAALFFDLLWAPLFLGVLFLLDPLLGGIGLICALLLVGFALAGEIATRAPLAQAMNAQAKSYSRLWQALNSIHIIRALGMTYGAAKLIHDDAEEARNALQAVTHRTNRIQALARPTRALAQVVIMGAAAWLVLDGHRNPGIIFASSLLFGRGLAPIEGIASGWRTIGATRDAYRRLSDVLEAGTPAVRQNGMKLPVPTGHLTVSNVTYCLPGTNTCVLKGISFRLSPGECLGLIGPSGAGKSVLGRLIAGLSTPATGCIALDAIEVATWRRAGGGGHFGYMPQEIELFGGSVGEAIGRLTGSDQAEVIEAARLVGLHEAIMQLPRAYDTEMSEAAGRLLLGQRQRLGIARACFRRPRLVVLDEPNANLDHRGEQILFNVIETLKASGATVVVITHRTGILPATDKIAILEAGSLSAFGRSQEIFERHLRHPQIDASRRPSPPTEVR
ncbi:type I secretion system permease/ATPase [Microvirga lotononidis]|nr:type I secretion system permease/ATPase [Microvirga lotononidis]WQO29745.1 type I secretion system permease/ATPase [Microvirga lotononidis]